MLGDGIPLAKDSQWIAVPSFVSTPPFQPCPITSPRPPACPPRLIKIHNFTQNPLKSPAYQADDSTDGPRTRTVTGGHLVRVKQAGFEGNSQSQKFSGNLSDPRTTRFRQRK
jgi:hypothetical protein